MRAMTLPRGVLGFSDKEMVYQLAGNFDRVPGRLPTVLARIKMVGPIELPTAHVPNIYCLIFIAPTFRKLGVHTCEPHAPPREVKATNEPRP